MIRSFGKEEDIRKLFNIIQTWLNECRINEFGIEVEVTAYLDEINKLIYSADSDLLVMELDEKIIGLMGISASKSPIGNQKIASGHYWYTLPEHRGKGISFILAAKKWAKGKGCTHLMCNANNMAGDLHDKVCQIYQRIGMKKIETSYIQQLEGSHPENEDTERSDEE